jgi:tetratricopeptide (TPR) repeat protein
MSDEQQLNNGHGQNDETEDLENWISERFREDFQRNMRLAAELLERRRGAEAVELLEPCLKHEPQNLDVILNLSSAYILVKKYDRAAELLERGTELAPDDPALWSNLGAAYLGFLAISTPRKQERALEAYHKVLEIDETYPNTYYNIGLIHVDRSEWEKADEAFRKAIRVNPWDKDARLWRKRMAKEMRDESENEEDDQDAPEDQG